MKNGLLRARRPIARSRCQISGRPRDRCVAPKMFARPRENKMIPLSVSDAIAAESKNRHRNKKTTKEDGPCLHAARADEQPFKKRAFPFSGRAPVSDGPAGVAGGLLPSNGRWPSIERRLGTMRAGTCPAAFSSVHKEKMRSNYSNAFSNSNRGFEGLRGTNDSAIRRFSILIPRKLCVKRDVERTSGYKALKAHSTADSALFTRVDAV